MGATVAFRYVELGRDLRSKVSPQDYERVAEHKWRPQVMTGGANLYAKANIYKVNVHGRRYRSTIFMHRFIVNAPDYLNVDHDDNDGLNNTRPNLIACRQGYNGINRKPYGKVAYKGVSVRGNKFVAAISDFRQEPTKSVYIGMFDNAMDAARAYDRRAIELYGPFFPINFPLTDYPELAGDAVAKAALPDPLADIPF